MSGDILKANMKDVLKGNACGEPVSSRRGTRPDPKSSLLRMHRFNLLKNRDLQLQNRCHSFKLTKF